jgi:fluoride exporter
MKELLLVAFGGAIGAVARWKLSGLILHHTLDWKFPAATFTVNVIGCMIAGVVAGLIVKQDMFTPATRLFLLTGLLGGFTTFSAFGIECMYLMRRGEFTVMSLYVLLTVCATLAGLMLAMWLIPGQSPHP